MLFAPENIPAPFPARRTLWWKYVPVLTAWQMAWPLWKNGWPAGAKLGWYIDPYSRRVYIYRAGREVEVLDNPQTLSGEDLLPGFAFDVTRLLFDCHGV